MPITTNADLLDKPSAYLGTNPFPLKEVDDWSVDAQGNVIIPFGFGVVKGAGEGATLPVDANSVFLGWAVAVELEKRVGYSVDSQGFYGYPLLHRMSIRRRGPIMVRTVQAVSADDPVFLIHTPNSGQRAGMVRRDADTNRATRAGAWLFADAAPANSDVAIYLI
jgi:hypothetical protein